MGIKVKNFESGHMTKKQGFVPGTDSGGGLLVKGTVENTGECTISQINLFFTPYDRKDEVVRCTEKLISEHGIIIEGPIESGKEKKFQSGILWKNPSIVNVRVTGAIVEYKDGRTKKFSRENIPVVRKKSEGCYVATAVYGSYDCPQVWVLRRFRDFTLAKTWYGRMFIRTYYAISPTLVKWFGNRKWFQDFWRIRLDGMVSRLQKKGFSDTPYEDR